MKLAYICDYCGEIFSEDVIKQHEDSCNFNPKNKTCLTCSHCVTDYDHNIKCSVKSVVSVSFLYQDMITRNCKEYEEGIPAKLLYL